MVDLRLVLANRLRENILHQKKLGTRVMPDYRLNIFSDYGIRLLNFPESSQRKDAIDSLSKTLEL